MREGDGIAERRQYRTIVKARPQKFGQGGRHAQATDGTYFSWPRGRHSEKPEAFYLLVEQLSPGPYLDMFARTRRLGWDAWGDEVDSDVEIA